MKNNKRMYLLLEFGLALMVVLLAFVMILENNEEDLARVSVIVQDSEDNQWTAFKYGLRMAAQDQKIEMFVVSTGAGLTLEEERDVILREIENGADAVIVQPVPGADTGKMLQKIAKRVPVMLVGQNLPKEEDPESGTGIPVTEADHRGMGKALAEELLEDYSGRLDGKTFGLIAEEANSVAALERMAGFREAVADKGAQELWAVCGTFQEEGEKTFVEQPKVDFVIALDDGSLTMAGECASANDLHGALVYGIGNSTEADYYLDTGAARCLVVPDDFSIGYQSLTAIAKSLGNYFYELQDQEVSYTVMRRDTLFTKENQEILFTMSQ